ncbi:hypothetical protein [Halorubellus sp. PRR65]|uniref:hypothetical protein n=1 Tax=Halorubellus sp. PRR65 TaxID=3098148 RepID=UPI002B25BD90|nr:hypothetical protein [Halorubellus sp. PRR65]
METEPSPELNSHLRAIRTAIVGVALGVVTAALIVHNEPLAFPLLIMTCLVSGYAFVPTLRA